MLRHVRRAAVVAGLLQASSAFAQMSGLNPTAVEIALLPRFCWGQMEVPDAEAPEYNIPAGCGWGMNHYCPGLVWLIRAKSAVHDRDRVGFLRRASGEVRYTVRAIEKFPGCPVRAHVEQTIAEIESLAVTAPSSARRTAPATSTKVPGAAVVPR